MALRCAGLRCMNVHIHRTLRSLGKLCWENVFQKIDAEPLDMEAHESMFAAVSNRKHKVGHVDVRSDGNAILWLLRPDGACFTLMLFSCCCWVWCCPAD